MTVVGELAMWIAFFLAAWASGASFAGRALRRAELVESGARATLAAAATTALACVGLWAALLRHDFAVDYVAAHTTMNTPTLYLLTAFWAGRGGRVLWWALTLAVCACIVVGARRREGQEPAAPWAVPILATVLAVALATVCLFWSPFQRVQWVPAEGRGLAPALQNPWAAPYFVTLYPAYALAIVAVVVGVGAARRARHIWATAVHGWLLAAWCLATAGIALRMRWAYSEPALGSGWTWDVAQSATMALWLVITAVVRSLLVPKVSAESSGAVRRRVPGMYAVYLGAAVLVVGLASQQHWRQESIRLQPGQAAEARDPYRGRWRFVSQGASRDERLNYLSTGVAVEAWRGGANVGIVAAERRQYLDSGQRPVSEPAMKPGIRSFFALDLYVLLTEVRGELAELRLSFRPLVSCVWIGWAIVLGGVIAVVAQLQLAPRAGTRPVGGPAGASAG